MGSDFYDQFDTKEDAYQAGLEASALNEDGDYFDGLSDLTKFLSERGVDYKFDLIGNTEFILLPAQVLRVKGGDDRGAIYFSPLDEYEGFKATNNV